MIENNQNAPAFYKQIDFQINKQITVINDHDV